jgi:large subunit ribosomal protein L22
MEVQAISKSVRVSPRKMRLVADAIRHLSIDDALSVLATLHKRAALPLTKTINSAVANAVNNAKLERNALVFGSIQISDGQVLKRFRPSTRGRIHPYKKRGSNIHIVLKSVSMPTAGKPVVAEPKKENKKAAETKIVEAEIVTKKGDVKTKNQKSNLKNKK